MSMEIFFLLMDLDGRTFDIRQQVLENLTIVYHDEMVCIY